MVATRFAVALHILLFITFGSEEEATSARMALSIGTNPVVVRRIAGQLARAGLITVQRGPGGASLARPAESITLEEVWRAIHPARERLIRVHATANAADKVGRIAPEVIRSRLDAAEAALLRDLAATSIADLAQRMMPERRRAS
ncbi:MAG TPA: Rrf2 family transcriptional regulator [Crenalkalicoccus sp.]|jgi:DNA-binding IscR family transcriptional regulator|nr:Rrf2 family transcriptional regulator [Crenalkalicoccus sp.]